eukprot:scaffold8157_cov116-Skeletonema_dohrnii-CCMP3373.AAC.3
MRFNRAEDGGVHISVEQLWLAVGIFGEGRGAMSMLLVRWSRAVVGVDRLDWHVVAKFGR